MGNAIVTASFPSEERGRALGVIGAMVGAGMVCGPALGGFLLDILGWRSIFYFWLPLGIIGAVMAWTLLKEKPSPEPEQKFDLLGASIVFVAMACLLIAVNRVQSLGLTSPLVVGLGVMGVLLLLLFFFVERRAVQPVLDLRLFLSRLFSAASASHVFLHISAGSLAFLMPFYLIQGLGFYAAKAGLLLVTIPAIRIVVAPVSGRLSDRLGGTFSLCTLGLMLFSGELFLLSRLGANASIGSIVLYLIIVGAGMAVFETPNVSAIMGSVPGERLGTASAMVATLRQGGTSIGLAITGTVFTASQFFHATRLASEGLAEDTVRRLSTVSGFHDAVFAVLALALVGLVASLLRGRR